MLSVHGQYRHCGDVNFCYIARYCIEFEFHCKVIIKNIKRIRYVILLCDRMPSISRLRQLDLNITRRIDELTQLKETLHKQLISLQVMELSAKAALRKYELEEEKAKECEMDLKRPRSSSSAIPSSSVRSSPYAVRSSTSGVRSSTSSVRPSTSGVHPSTSGVYSSFETRQLSPARLSDDDSLVCLEPLDLNFQKPYYEEIFIESEDEDF
ncbi:hypothetical protein X975_11611, partial [Stegodyphus mimosarum]